MRHVPLLAAVCVATLLPAQDRPRPAAAILREFGAVAMPSISDGSSQEAKAAFQRAVADRCRRQGELALELFTAHPDHAKVPELMGKRWAGMTNALDAADAVLAELQPLLERDDLAPLLRREAMLARARAALVSERVSAPDKLKRIREAMATGDERLGVMLVDLASAHLAAPEPMRQVLELALARWPDSAWVANPAKGLLRQLDKVGKPLPLAFDDVLGGGRIDVAAIDSPYVLVMVWSGDADYSRGQIEALLRLRQQVPAEQLAIVGVCGWHQQGGADGLAAKLRQCHIDLPHCLAEDAEPAAWSVPRLPFFFLLEGGKVVGVATEVAMVRERLADLRTL